MTGIVTAIEQYANEIVKGKAIVGKYIRKLYCDFLLPIVQGKRADYYYDDKLVNFYFEFSRQCKQSIGKWANQPIEYLTYQRAFFEALLGIRRRSTHKLRFNQAFVEMGRKNGKTTMLTPLPLFHLLTEPSAQAYVVATKLSQAKLLWEECQKMLNRNPDLQAVYKKPIQAPIPTISYKDSKFQALALNPKKQDGLNVSLAILDEVHELPREVYDVLIQGISARSEPLLLMITTAGTKRGGLFDDKVEYSKKLLDGLITDDDSLLPVLYEMDQEDDPYDEKNWYKANPGLGVIKNLDSMRRNAIEAKNDKCFELTFFTKDLNLVTKSSTAWLMSSTIINHAKYTQNEIYENFKGAIVVGGFDLSMSGDLTAFVTLGFDQKSGNIFCLVQCWCSAKFLNSKDASRSGVPWSAWIHQGYVKVSGDERIEYRDITEYVVNNVQKYDWVYRKIGYDPYSSSYLINDLQNEGFSKDKCLISVRQGFKSLSQPMAELKHFLEQKKLVYQDNPVFAWMLSNVQLEEDRNGNWMPSKKDSNASSKIDAVSACLDALYCYLQEPFTYMPGYVPAQSETSDIGEEGEDEYGND